MSFSIRRAVVIQTPVVFGANVRKSVLFPVSPNVLHRIQFRRIAGEVFYPQATSLTGDEVARDFAAVRRQTIPDNQQGTRNMTEQRP
jgi:hypothetical protein